MDCTIKSLYLVNLYAPNRDDATLFECIQETIPNLKDCGSNIIITGDFNTVLDTMMDRTGNSTVNYHPHGHGAIQTLISSLILLIYGD